MTDSTDFWTDLATTHRPDSAAAPATDQHDHEEPSRLGIVPAAPPVSAPEIAAPLIVAPEPATPLPPAADSARSSAVSLHPRMHLALDELLDAESLPTHNLAILVGSVRCVPFGRRRDAAANAREKQAKAAASGGAATTTDPHQTAPKTEGRFDITDYGIREDRYHLEIQEVAGDDLDRAIPSYRLELGISHRLIESGLFHDGQRLAICGPLRMERTYDERFAADRFDPGRPEWTTRLEVISMLPVDETTPDGSFVELIGVVEGEPRIRREMIGAGASEPFATVRLRCRRQLRSGIGRSRAVFTTSTVLPLAVPLAGDLAHAGALLRDGNTVHIHGRLVQYRYRMAVRTAPNSPERTDTPDRTETTGRTERKSVPEVLEAIAAATRDRLGHWTNPPTATRLAEEIHKAQQRALTVIKPTIEVGYVELRHGTALSDAEIAELIAHWRPGPRSDHVAPRGKAPRPAVDSARTALDSATAAAFPPQRAEAAVVTPAPSKPRRRPRADDAPAAAAEPDRDGGSDQDADDAA